MVLFPIFPVQFAHPVILWAIPVFAILFIILLAKEFVKTVMDEDERRKLRRLRIWLFITRILMVTLLLLALAHPYVEQTAQVKGNPRVTILVDKSASMNVMNTKFVSDLEKKLGEEVTTTVRTIGTNKTSDIGSAILRNLEPGGNVLLISDGNVNLGTTIADAAFYATTLNATISTINISPNKDDAAVTISGPTKVVAESDSTFTIKVTATNKEKMRHLIVTVDDSKLLDKDVLPGDITFSKQFLAGDHRMSAEITTPDSDKENNKFYKSIHVLKKPRILLVTEKNSPLELLLRKLYNVDKSSVVPLDLSPYYAIIMNDVPIEKTGNMQTLHNYLIDEKGEYYGGGLVVFGGLNSYNNGGYSRTPFEQLLPVHVGKGKREKGAANLVFVVDVSGSTGRTKYVVENGKTHEVNVSVPTVDVIKAQLKKAIEQLKIKNRVGVIVFGTKPGGSFSSAEELISDTVKIVEPLDFLYNNRKELLNKVVRIEGGGPTAADIGLRGAIKMLQNVQGEKNIILLTDGRYSAGIGSDSPMKRQLLTIASNAHKLYGINFMTIGVGTTDPKLFPKRVDEIFLKEFAKAGDGTYDRATQLNTLLIKWGDPKANKYGEEFTLVPLSLTHFITRDIEPTAILNGYNQVIPKDTANLLITSDGGEPALTTWRYGNGRVASWTVFSGNNLGQLLNKDNSILLSRTVNWAIGDPQRKESYSVELGDARIGEETTIKVRSDSPLKSKELVFSKDGERYVATFTPSTIGFSTILGTEYAINRPRELDAVGINPELESAVISTGGKVFKPSEDKEIAEFIKKVSKRVHLEQKSVIMSFLISFIILFLIEIAFRRITERRE